MGSCVYAFRTVNEEKPRVTIGMHYGTSLQLWNRFADLPDPTKREFRICPVNSDETSAFLRFMRSNLKRGHLHVADDEFRDEAWSLFGILSEMCVAEGKASFIMTSANKKLCDQLQTKRPAPVVKGEDGPDISKRCRISRDRAWRKQRA